MNIVTPTKKPRLTLVGAGPGDPDLITLKGRNALQQADVVLYDALIDASLLGYVRGDVPRIYVGKRGGESSHTQAEINNLIVSYAHSLGHVVRLKGGDPFVFGRGYEEILYARLHGVETSYIPGITSAISVPGLAGLPVTHRGTSEGFLVVTATDRNNALMPSIAQAARHEYTVVILMGLSKLKEIVAVYQGFGKHATPIAIIANGATRNEKVIKGNISNIQAIADAHDMQPPALLVVGDVVALLPDPAPDVLQDSKPIAYGL